MKLTAKGIALAWAILVSMPARAHTAIGVAGGYIGAESDSTAFGEFTAETGGRTGFGASGLAEFSAEGTVRYYGGDSVPWASARGTAKIGSLIGRNAAAVRVSVSGETPDGDLPGNTALSLSFPVTFNGNAASFFLEPGLIWDPLTDGYSGASLDCSANLAAGDSILKPGFFLSYARFRDGTAEIDISPSAGAAWYPGVPATAGASLRYRREWDPGIGSAEDSLEARVEAAVSLSRAFLVSAESSAFLSASDLMTENAFMVTVSPSGSGPFKFSFPLEARFFTGSGFSAELTAGLRLEY